MNLSKTQQRALKKLTDKWQNAYQLQESLSTLNSLVIKKLAEKKSSLGCYFMPRINNKFRKLK